MEPLVWTIIADYSEFKEKIVIRSLCRRVRSHMPIIDLPRRLEFKLSDALIKRLKLTNLQTLNASCNPNITDDGIRFLSKLQTLYASYHPNITNDGIRHLTNLRNTHM